MSTVLYSSYNKSVRVSLDCDIKTFHIIALVRTIGLATRVVVSYEKSCYECENLRIVREILSQFRKLGANVTEGKHCEICDSEERD